MTDSLRSLAQSVLLAAVDSSYAFSFVNILSGVLLRPDVTARKVITKFGQKAAKSWFEHTKPKDLKDIQIYNTVRDGIVYNFGFVLATYLESGLQSKLNLERTHVAYFKFAHEDQSKTAA